MQNVRTKRRDIITLRKSWKGLQHGRAAPRAGSSVRLRQRGLLLLRVPAGCQQGHPHCHSSAPIRLPGPSPIGDAVTPKGPPSMHCYKEYNSVSHLHGSCTRMRGKVPPPNTGPYQSQGPSPHLKSPAHCCASAHTCQIPGPRLHT